MEEAQNSILNTPHQKDRAEIVKHTDRRKNSKNMDTAFYVDTAAKVKKVACGLLIMVNGERFIESTCPSIKSWVHHIVQYYKRSNM